MPELNETTDDCRDVTKDPMMVKAEDAEEPTETRSDVAIDSEEKMNISPHVMKAGAAEEPKCEAQVAVEDIIEMSIEVKAEDTKEPEEPILVRVANVKKLDETAESCKDAASEPVMVKAEDAEEPREAAQTAVEDILEMSMEMKAEYAKEHEELAERTRQTLRRFEMYTISVQVEEVVLMMKEVASMEEDGLPYMMVETVKCGVAYMVAHMASR